MWRRRPYFSKSKTSSGDGDEQFRLYSSSHPKASSNNDILCFFCMRSPRSRVGSRSLSDTDGSGEQKLDQELEVEEMELDLSDLKKMFGPSRFLSTILEEEREGMESPTGHRVNYRSNGGDGRKRMTLMECFMATEEAAVAKAAAAAADVEEGIDDGSLGDGASFSTPSSSPLYLTPPASPDVVEVNGEQRGDSELISDGIWRMVAGRK